MYILLYIILKQSLQLEKKLLNSLGWRKSLVIICSKHPDEIRPSVGHVAQDLAWSSFYCLKGRRFNVFIKQ